MRAAVLMGPRRVEVVELEPPELLPGSVLVAVDRCGIGGPDVAAWETGDVPAPAWFGHEWSGRIHAVGEEVGGRFVGERVVGATAPPCGRCDPCRAGFGSRCELSLAMILGTDPLAGGHGAFAEVIRVDARRVHRTPESVGDDEAALAEPAAVAAHAVGRAGQRLGDLVVVVGAGTIGLLVSELARLAGAARVVAVDPDSERRELACALGAHAAVGSASDLGPTLVGHGHGLGADVVYECAGGYQAAVAAVAAARPGGTLVLVGGSVEPGLLTGRDLRIKELTIRASLGYGVGDVHRVLELMADDRLVLDAMWDSVIGFDELAATLEALSQGSRRRKVLVASRR